MGANKFYFFLLKEKYDSREEKEIIVYSLSVILSECSKMVIIGMIFSNLNELHEYLFSLTLLFLERRLGMKSYHAKSYLLCLFVSICYFLFIIYGADFLSIFIMNQKSVTWLFIPILSFSTSTLQHYLFR